MSNKLFVGNLDVSTTDRALRAAFESAGTILSATVIIDRATGNSRGFGFVEYESPDQASDARDAMNGSLLDGSAIRVDIAHGRMTR